MPNSVLDEFQIVAFEELDCALDALHTKMMDIILEGQIQYEEKYNALLEKQVIKKAKHSKNHPLFKKFKKSFKMHYCFSYCCSSRCVANIATSSELEFRHKMQLHTEV